MNKLNFWQMLGYLGLVPFIVPLCVSLFDLSWFNFPDKVFVSYSAVILSFLAGTLWQINIKRTSNYQLSLSNLFSVFAFIGLLLNLWFHVVISLLVLGISYATLFLYEFAFVKPTNKSYFFMRLSLTLIVVLLHVIASFLWYL